MLIIEPETLRAQHPNMTEEEFNKLQAILTIKNTNAPFEDFYVFENVVWALNLKVPNTNVFTPPPVKWIWYALKEIKDFRPNMELSEEVETYIKIVSKSQGYAILPELHFDSMYTKNIRELADSGKPLGETEQDLQASKLLEIDMYLKKMSDN